MNLVLQFSIYSVPRSKISVLRFFIYSVLRIRSTVPVRFDLVDWTPFSISCTTPKDSLRQELNIVYSYVDEFDFNNLDGTFIIKLF